MLTTLLPVRMAPSRPLARLQQTIDQGGAPRLPVFSIRSIRAREEAVSAVSLPEKKKESARQSTMTTTVTASLRCSLLGELLGQKGADLGGIDHQAR